METFSAQLGKSRQSFELELGSADFRLGSAALSLEVSRTRVCMCTPYKADVGRRHGLSEATSPDYWLKYAHVNMRLRGKAAFFAAGPFFEGAFGVTAAALGWDLTAQKSSLSTGWIDRAVKYSTSR